MANGEPEEFLRRKRESVERTGNSMGIVLSDLNMVVKHNLLGWATPTTRDYKDGASIQNVPENALLGRQAHQVSGVNTTSPPAGTVKAAASPKAVLNPAFSAWLMGFSLEWLLSGIRGIRSHGKRLKAAQRSLKG